MIIVVVWRAFVYGKRSAFINHCKHSAWTRASPQAAQHLQPEWKHNDCKHSAPHVLIHKPHGNSSQDERREMTRRRNSHTSTQCPVAKQPPWYTRMNQTLITCGPLGRSQHMQTRCYPTAALHYINILTCSVYTMPKGRSILGALTF